MESNLARDFLRFAGVRRADAQGPDVRVTQYHAGVIAASVRQFFRPSRRKKPTLQHLWNSDAAHRCELR
jgi:hypothetical protein